MPSISAYIPCYNDADSLLVTIDSLRTQTVALDELFVVDDGSSDSSVTLAKSAGVPVVELPANQGRGAARARAMQVSEHELVLCCDAGKKITSDFVERSLHRFQDASVAAVFGRFVQGESHTLAERWRARHLFKTHLGVSENRKASLVTAGAVLRKSAVLAVGNFNSSLRHTEDKELGDRLLAAGYDVVYDPTLEIFQVSEESMGDVLERYWRWYAGSDERISWKSYFKQIVFAARVMAAADLRDGDLSGAAVSLFSPHYQFWRSCIRKIRAG